MAELFNANGEPVEALSKEEAEEAQKTLEEEKNSEMETLKANFEAEKSTLQEQLDAQKAELAKYTDKDHNFKNLRQQKETAEEKLATLEKTFTEKTKELEDKLSVNMNTLKIGSMIDKIAGDDAELKKKIKFYYNSFTGVPENDEKVKERLDNAYVLATGHKIDNTLSSNVISSSGGRPPVPGVSMPGKLSNKDSAEVAHDLGISDDELKQHKLI